MNDNGQAIAETHGGIYTNMKALRDSNGNAENNWFTAFSLDYIYEEKGNDIASLIKIFEQVRDASRPVVVHVHTQKGKGYELAGKDKEGWHWCLPFDRATGKTTVTFAGGESYLGMTSQYIVEKAKKDKSFVVVTPAMPMSVGLGPEERATLGSQYIDTGIAEEAAVAIASGIARRGAKPLVVTNMTFLQRAYDQISQDICINKTAVTMLMNYTSFDGLTDVTHLGIFGLAAFTNIPNLVVLCPSSAEEYVSMLDWSLEQRENPVLILIPGNEVTHRPADKNYDDLNRFKIEGKGEKVAVIALGDFFQKGQELAAAIKEKYGFAPSLINPRFASGLDKELLRALEKNHRLVVTLEDGILEGGFGQKIASFYGPGKMLVKNYGLEKKFYDRYNPEELLRDCGMTTEQIVEDIKAALA